jgi:glycosyltransferase involved in cell wall biosynthesis
VMPPRGGWKFVVVDNGSTDSTQDVLRSFRGRLPLLTAIEPSPGKNAALNTGLGYVEGDLVVLTDDDVFPRSDWLVALRGAADAHGECAIFGGRVEPRWEAPPPPWILEWVPLDVTYSLTPHSMSEGPLDPGFVFGTNMAMRESVFASGYRFDASIGPHGTDYAMGSETELVRRLVRSGHRAWHCPDAVVRHWIRREHLDRRWILARATRFGRGQCRMHRADFNGSSTRIAGVPRHLLRELIRRSIAVAWARARGERGVVFRAQWDLRFLLGVAVEARAHHRASVRAT